MLTKLRNFFTFFNSEKNANSFTEISLETACAVLLCEVMRADGIFTELEQDKLKHLLMEQFSLSADDVLAIIEQAIHLSENASDFYQFTSRLNQFYSLEERKEIVDLLWQVAYADGDLANIEEHIIRKIADLLHLRHDEYIASKIKANIQHQ
jgi:uncharacterized tellurite resistance protein B-like protein